MQTPLAFTCSTGLVSAADSNGNTTSALILFTVTRSCSWLACSDALAAVFTITCTWPGCAFSRSFLASLAQYTMPAVKLWVAAGIATPSTTLLPWASAGAIASVAARAAAPSASLPGRFVMLVSFGGDSMASRPPGTAGCSPPPSLEEGNDDDHEPLHRRVQVHADDAGEVQDVADDGEQDGADHRAGDAARAALERGAADDHRRDRLQLPQQARGGRGGAEARNVQQRGDAHAQPQQHVREDLDPVDGHRGIARHLLVRSDRLHVTPVGRAIEDE